jgi:hypothetical protein
LNQERRGGAENGFIRWKYGLHLLRETEKAGTRRDAEIYEAYSHFAKVTCLATGLQFVFVLKSAWSFEVILTDYFIFCSKCFFYR